jgi:ABC-type antimicrobial peptide transport system permease subunit
MNNSLPNLLALYIPLLLAILVLGMLLVTRRIPFQYSIRNLLTRWKTTVMTSTAFTVVVLLLTVMVAFVAGMNRVIGRSAHPGNVVVLSDGATDEVFSSLAITDATEIEHQEGPVWKDGRAMSSREVYIFINQPTTAPDGRSRHRFLQIRGVEDPDIAASVHGLELLPGSHWFSTGGVREASTSESPGEPAKSGSVIEAVIGEAIAQEFGADRGLESLQIGDTFEVGPRRWLVVGIMKAPGSAFGSEIWAKRSIVGQTFGKDNLYTSLVLQTPSAAAAQALADNLTHHYKKASLHALTEADYYSKMGEASEQLLSAIFLVASIMAVGGVFGVMNTMFAAIAQRASDIGVLRILGFARWQILASFLLESLVIALAGGVLGCGLGYLVNGVSASTMVGSNDGIPRSVIFEMVVDPNTLALGLLFTLLMGAVGGLLPALSAMRLRPLESLR